MTEQVELVGGPLDGQLLNVRWNSRRTVWMYELPEPGTAPCSLMRDMSDYKPDAANPRRFVYVQPK